MTIFWFKINYCCYFILELSESVVLGKGCAKMVCSPFHLKGFVLHCLVTHCDIGEVICSFRWCTGQIKMMEDLQDGYHSNAHNTHTTVPHLIAQRETLDSAPVVLLLMVEQCTHFPSIFRSEDSSTWKMWHNKLRNMYSKFHYIRA